MSSRGHSQDEPWQKLEFESDPPRESGIYAWYIEDVGIYVGKGTDLRRRTREYPNNLRRLFRGLPYRRNDPEGFRWVHEQLADALRNGRRATWRLLELCSQDELNARERYWIAEIGNLNGMRRRRNRRIP